MATVEEMLTSLRKDLNKRTRFDVIDNFVDPPATEEIDAAIFDAIQDINSFSPMTSHTLGGIYGQEDKRWHRALVLGSARNVVNLLIADWTAHGISVDLGEGVSLEDRLGNYQSLLSNLTEQFDTLVERLKESAVRNTSLVSFNTRAKDRRDNQSFARRARNRVVTRRSGG